MLLSLGVASTNLQNRASLSAIPTNDLSHNLKSTVPPSHVASQSGPTAKPTLYVKTPSSAQVNSRFSNSAVSLLNAFGHHASTSGSDLAAAIHKRRLSGLTSPTNDEHLHAIRSQGDSSLIVQPEFSVGETPVYTGKQSTRPKSYLLRQYMAPMNPRDHTILDTIYSEMLSSRFINAAPLSLLQNYLEYHFTGLLPGTEAVDVFTENAHRYPNTPASSFFLSTDSTSTFRVALRN